MTFFYINAAGELLEANSREDAVVKDAVLITEEAPTISGLQIWNFDTEKWGAVPAIDQAITELTLKEVEELLLENVPAITKAKIDAKKNARNSS